MKFTYLVIIGSCLVLNSTQGTFGKKKMKTNTPKPRVDHEKSQSSKQNNYINKFVDLPSRRAAIDSIRRELDVMKSDLQGRTDVAATQLRHLLNRTKAGLTNLDNRWLEIPEARRGAIVTALTSAAGKLTMFKDAGSDPIQGFRGAIEIVATFASLAGPHGQIVSAALSFISGFLSLFGKGEEPKPMNQILREEIEKWYSRHLTLQAQGAISSFENSQAFLDGATSDLDPDELLNDSETTSLSAHIPVYQNINFMGSLRQEINGIKAENTIEDAVKCLKYLELWARMALLKDVILQRMAAIMSNTQPRIRSGVYSVQQGVRTKARNLFKFLWEAGVGNNIVPFFDPDKYPIVDKYLSTVLKEPGYDRSMGGTYKLNVGMGNGRYGRLGFDAGVFKVNQEDQMANIVDGGNYYWKFVPHGHNLYSIVNKYNCPDDPLCDALLTWTESHGIYHATLEHDDPALWQLSNAGGGRYRLKCKWGCDTGHEMCDAELSYQRFGVGEGNPFIGVIITRSGGKTWGLTEVET